jgi:hypothetical protein
MKRLFGTPAPSELPDCEEMVLSSLCLAGNDTIPFRGIWLMGFVITMTEGWILLVFSM